MSTSVEELCTAALKVQHAKLTTAIAKREWLTVARKCGCRSNLSHYRRDLSQLCAYGGVKEEMHRRCYSARCPLLK